MGGRAGGVAVGAVDVVLSLTLRFDFSLLDLQLQSFKKKKPFKLPTTEQKRIQRSINGPTETKNWNKLPPSNEKWAPVG